MRSALFHRISPVFGVLLLGVGAQAQTCGDGTWAACEFCGRDAYAAVGHTEMNHDCVVDVVDLGMFARDYGYTGILSGDFNGDGICNLTDFAAFALCFATHSTVGSCEACNAQPIGCGGLVRVSLSETSPTDDVDTISLTPGQPHNLHVVTENTQGMVAFTGCVLTSANVVLGTATYEGTVPLVGYGTGWGAPIATNDPVLVGGYSFFVTDTAPATIEPVDCALSNASLAWSTISPPRKFQFAVVASAGVNGPAPADQSPCTPTDVSAQETVLRLWSFPNPAEAAVHCVLPADWRSYRSIDVRVMDVRGREIRAFSAAPASGIVTWDGNTAHGARAAAGAYFVVFKSGERTLKTRVTLVQ